MELFRLPPYQLTVDYSSLTSDTDYVLRLFDNRNATMLATGATSDGSGDITFTIPDAVGKYDGEYSAVVHLGTQATDWTYESTTTLDDYSQDDVAKHDNLKIVRPYLVPADITPDGSNVSDYVTYERTARRTIDNVVGGFYFTRNTVDRLGMGTDVLTIGQRINDVVSVVENNVALFERGGSDNTYEFTLTSDKQSLIVYSASENNLIDSRPSSVIPIRGDYSGGNVRVVDFPVGYNYTVVVETGWPYVPQDIQDATQILVEEYACQVPNYMNRYVREYETKDFRVDIHRPGFAHTGNMTVDRILDKYLGETLFNNVRVL